MGLQTITLDSSEWEFLEYRASCAGNNVVARKIHAQRERQPVEIDVTEDGLRNYKLRESDEKLNKDIVEMHDAITTTEKTVLVLALGCFRMFEALWLDSAMRSPIGAKQKFQEGVEIFRQLEDRLHARREDDDSRRNIQTAGVEKDIRQIGSRNSGSSRTGD